MIGTTCHQLREFRLCLSQFGFLGRDDLGHPIIRLHGPHPAAQAIGGLGGLLNQHWLKVGILDVRPDAGWESED